MAFVAIHRGRLLGTWGDAERRVGVASVRKSLLSSLLGRAIARGALRLSDPLAEYGIDDAPDPLTPEEKQATLADLLAARSGITHPAIDQVGWAERPPRGSLRPGERFLYNNWDFNALGVIYERATGTRIGPAFAREIAAPTGMQDFAPEDVTYKSGPVSTIAAYKFRASARDLARFGLLHLHGGVWRGAQIVPAWWVRLATRPHSRLPGGLGYGLQWWTGSGRAFSPRVALRGASFWASGTGGQQVFVLPWCDLVLVHLVADTAQGIEGDGVARLLAAVLDGIGA